MWIQFGFVNLFLITVVQYRTKYRYECVELKCFSLVKHIYVHGVDGCICKCKRKIAGLSE